MLTRYPLSLLLCLYLYASSVLGAGGKDPYVYFFDETWGNFQEEVERAREMGKKGILIFFEMDECPFCHRMKETVLNQPEVQAYFKQHFLNIAVDIEGDVEITGFSGEVMSQKDFAFKINRVRATPVFAFYDLSGKQIVRYTGATNGIQEFLWLGEFVVQGGYEKMRFSKYKRERKKAQEKL
ncbi:MAG: thioredoxin family protein [Gammaproteobacteria bacterium]|nr:thioredoxin family protein [Gammaproteobacteria bacterium]MDH5801118.1 thioredoxin family protein [Gammaproteobacteria bacterium]